MGCREKAFIKPKGEAKSLTRGMATSFELNGLGIHTSKDGHDPHYFFNVKSN